MSPTIRISRTAHGLLRRRGTGGRHGAEDGDGRCDARVTGSGAEDPAHGDPLLAGDPLDHREATVPRRRADRPALAASAQEIALDCDGIVGRDEDRQGDEGLGECWVRAAFVPPLQRGAEPRGRRGKHRIVHDEPTAVLLEQREIAHDEVVRHVLVLDRFGFHPSGRSSSSARARSAVEIARFQWTSALAGSSRTASRPFSRFSRHRRFEFIRRSSHAAQASIASREGGSGRLGSPCASRMCFGACGQDRASAASNCRSRASSNRSTTARARASSELGSFPILSPAMRRRRSSASASAVPLV